MYFWVFRFFPKSAFSRLMGWMASRQAPRPLLTLVIRVYVLAFGIDMRQFQKPTGGFSTFNEFFTRPLVPGARPIAKGKTELACPVDGHVSQAGPITAGQLIQAKGLKYSVEELLGGDESWKKYEGGQFVTIYLSPKDYHRIHTPIACDVTRFAYIPGELWTVSPAGVRGVPRLFSRNERVVSFLDTDIGEMALVKVGATVVGSVRVVYHSVMTNKSGAKAQRETLVKPHPLAKGEELGRFELGSTVILLFQPGQAELVPLQPDQPLQLGEVIAHTVEAKTTKKASEKAPAKAAKKAPVKAAKAALAKVTKKASEKVPAKAAKKAPAKSTKKVPTKTSTKVAKKAPAKG